MDFTFSIKENVHTLIMRTHIHTRTHTLSLIISKRIQLTAIRGFMSASAMPLCSVTRCKVDQGPLYPARSRGILEAPTKKKKRRGPLASESNSAVRRFFPLPPPSLSLSLSPLSFQLCLFLCFSSARYTQRVLVARRRYTSTLCPQEQPNSDDRRSLRNRFVRPSLVHPKLPVLDLDSLYTALEASCIFD